VFDEGAVFLLELLEIDGFGVGGSGLPEMEQDADPFEGEGSDGGVVFHAGGLFHGVEGFGPCAPLAGMVREFVERLPQEFGTGVRLVTEQALPLLRVTGAMPE